MWPLKQTKMIKYIPVSILLAVFLSLQAFAQDSYPERARQYVRQYAEYAIKDQRASGVPAAITLGQGILETEAGISELAVKANNHFGIKCKNGWTGETIRHTDDARNECFKKYKSAQESYNDHSHHLHRNPRYHCLFGYPATDYKKWAHGLKKCGYATNPKYAYELIKIIEEYGLQEYTIAAMDSLYQMDVYDTATPEAIVADDGEEDIDTVIPKPTTAKKQDDKGFDAIARMADSVRIAIALKEAEEAVMQTKMSEDGEVILVNGLRAVRAHKDDMLLQYAVKHKIRYAHLLEMNDLPDEPLAFDTYVYLEKKRTTGIREKHTVKSGENLLMIAQEEGIQLKKLAALNLLSVYDQPETGAALELQTTAVSKPSVQTSAIKVINSTATVKEEEQAIPAYTYEETPAKLDTVAAPEAKTLASEQEEGFGMSFQAPKLSSSEAAKAVGDMVQREEADTAVIQQEKKINKPAFEEDPSQPQLKKPATEKVYKAGDKHHIVRRGETAYAISKKYGITVAELLKWNAIEAEDLKAGQTIIVKQ